MDYRKQAKVKPQKQSCVLQEIWADAQSTPTRVCSNFFAWHCAWTRVLQLVPFLAADSMFLSFLIAR